ncbi:putative bifunctional diguanylate cyclase/phosphodiesterase [Nostoc sp. CMAA1605]|uniref:putative bifunctional diguanylate cyclase/phosphodiesterase n=1 Tax=Nostoc sp. CMAA1605 TaxID=2055159 RepID=UPI001F358432|nr:EAL domain-containing protein [Nostoc sp. CMAA1605]
MIVGDFYYQQAIAVQISANRESLLLSDLQIAMLETLPTREFVPLLQNPTNLKKNRSQLPGRRDKIHKILTAINSSTNTSSRTEFTILLNKSQQAADEFYQSLIELLNGFDSRSTDKTEALIKEFTRGKEFTDITSLAYRLTPYIKEAREREYIAIQAVQKSESLRIQILTVSMSISVVIAITLAVTTSRVIAQPIETITQVAKVIKRTSNFALQVPVITSDEIGLLSTSFNELLQTVAEYIEKLSQNNQKLLAAEEALKVSYTELEAHVIERTSQLAQANQKLQVEVAERKQAELKLLHQAFYDALTGLPNRSFFMNRLTHVVNYSQLRPDYMFAVLFIDLDDFKFINDSLGHAYGDQLLLIVAQRIKDCLRTIDLPARLGGDEFTVLLEGISGVKDVIDVVEQLQESLSRKITLAGQEVFTKASIGIALSSTGYEQPEDLLRNADLAMYQAKAKENSSYQVFDSDMHVQVLVRLQLETALRQAIERKEFQIYYQPIVSLATGKLTGFEALLRWLHPQKGIISPEEFISVAQESGLIVKIDQWVLYEVCSQVKEWQERFSLKSVNPRESALTISVNLCNPQFSQSSLLSYVDQVLKRTKLDAQSLKLEITESVIMENGDKAILVLKEIRNLGIQLAIDDFGTGYSSLGRLHQFPINELKIDRTFVSGKNTSRVNLEIVETIIILSKKLGISVTAEGIETEEQLAFLKKMKCEYGQGYFFSKPLDKSAAENLIAVGYQW